MSCVTRLLGKVCDNPEDDVHYTAFAATIGKLGRQLLTSTP
jgi:hypothetical protein